MISHTYQDGTERPISFASRTLSPSEQNYPQIEKEALSLVYGIKKFHAYLYGRMFTLVTDHKPLLTVLGPKNGIPPMAAAQLQSWALLLSAYNYSIEFKPMQQHANADGLLRLLLGNQQPPSTCLAFVVGEIQEAVRNTPALAPLHPWLWPTKPWQRVHVDFAGPFMGRMFMVVVDARAKWPEVIPMSSTTSSNTIDELCRLFAAYGLPRQLVSDNGPQFTSDEFATFCKLMGLSTSGVDRTTPNPMALQNGLCKLLRER